MGLDPRPPAGRTLPEEESNGGGGMDPDSLAELVRRSVGEHLFEVEGATLAVCGGRLFVRHAPPVQRAVDRLLALLRRTP